jgi:hypothetical protein
MSLPGAFEDVMRVNVFVAEDWEQRDRCWDASTPWYLRVVVFNRTWQPSHARGRDNDLYGDIWDEYFVAEQTHRGVL